MDSDETPAPDSSESADETVNSIMPYVMKCLAYCKFFEELDDRLCPVDKSKSSEHCHGDLHISEAILRAKGYHGEELADIFDVLRAQGGFCDCEVLYNVSETNRLKAEYWRAQAEKQSGGPASDPAG